MLITVPFYSALNKPFLLLGGERELMVLAMLISFLVAYVNPSLVNIVIGIVLWVAMSILLRMMAKVDPIMSKIYRRYIKYKKYYRAVASAAA